MRAQHAKDISGSSGRRWYVLRTRPKQEERAYHNLRSWNVDAFLPMTREHCFAKPGKQPGALAMFPSYLFACFNAEQALHKILFTRGVTDVVTFDGVPAAVEDEVIEGLRARTTPDGLVETMRPPAPGPG
jgi:transcriptional antiterminator RfaH